MKKIDFHIHTVSAVGKDAHFEFDLTKFQEYVDTFSLDAVAITNHNVFDIEQYKEIEALQNVVIFPGIEIDFEGGQLLLISESESLDGFNQKCESIKSELETGNKITADKLKEIFIDLNKYLLIPHYDKKPEVPQNIIESLSDYVFAGEVSSPKKFHRAIKDKNPLTPVVFSDVRISTDLNLDKHQGRHTFIQTNSSPLTLSAIKAVLRDKNKVFLSDNGRHGFFQVFSDGQKLSNGLNVVIGGRSTGKTHLLNELEKIFNVDEEERSIKYIKQFDLVKDDEKKFNERVGSERGAVREEYLKEFRNVVKDVAEIDLIEADRKLQRYIKTLLDFASSEKLQDEFSRAKLFKENKYSIRPNQGDELKNLLKAVILLLKNATYKKIIEQHVPKDNLQKLVDALTTEYKQMLEKHLKKEWVNELIVDIKEQLERKTSSPKIDDDEIDFYKVKLERESVRRFSAIARAIKKEKEIKIDTFGKFKIRIIAAKYQRAQGLHDESRRRISFADAFKKYDDPIVFLEKLKNIENLSKEDLYKYFCKVTYQVLNEYDKQVSGGEMAEFNLLRVLKDARQYEMLLVDEPESSFDNLFLKDNVNKEVKEIAKEMPVVVVTHNNTVGMLLEPDYILYTERKIIDGKDEYKIFSGFPGDKELKTADTTESVESHGILLDAFEAGQEAYNTRKNLYKNYEK